MRVSSSLISIGVLVFTSNQAVALSCKDISGAKVDPDLNIMASNFGRLLPDRKSVKQTRQQGQTVTLERLVATKISTPDGKASASLMLTNGNSTIVTATVNGETIKQTTQTALADLGYRSSVAKITTALAKIDQPAEAFVPPKINLPPKINNLSNSITKITLGQHGQKIAGSPTSEKKVAIQYTCTRNLEFAGNPAVLNTMVVLRGVLKATTVTTSTKINRFVDIKISDVATYKTVTHDQFKEILATLPKIIAMLSTPDIAKPEPTTSQKTSLAPTAIQTAEPATQNNTNTAPPASVQEGSFISKITTFFSLAKPETWIFLFLAMLLGNMVFLRSRTASKEDKVTAPNPEEEPTEISPDDQDVAVEPSLDLPEVANSDGQIEGLHVEIATAAKQAKELRNSNHKLKARLDDAENQSRDLTTQIIELQSFAAVADSNLTADKRSVFELQGNNQRLMGVNEGYRENIKKVEAEYTALMHKLNLREDTLSHAEKLNNKLNGFNEELNHSLLEERAARTSLETDYDRLSEDYNNLWSKSSDRVASFRNKDVDLKETIRDLRDDLISLDSELNSVRKDHENLNREFVVLGNENARASNEYKAATSLLESKVKQLHHDVAYYRQILDENRIRTPNRTHLPSATYRPRDYANYQAGRNQALDEQADKNKPADNNVVPLTRQNQDRRK